MTHWYYLLALLFSICGLLLLDWRHKLAFWFDARRTSLTILSTVVFFAIWDIAGISLGIFFHGSSAYTPKYMLWNNFPPEELAFLFLLTYLTLLMYRGAARGYRHLHRS